MERTELGELGDELVKRGHDRVGGYGVLGEVGFYFRGTVYGVNYANGAYQPLKGGKPVGDPITEASATLAAVAVLGRLNVPLNA